MTEAAIETRIVPIDSTQTGLQSPAEIVDFATDAANRLKDIVEKQKLFTNIQGKKYLNAEAWMTIIALDNAHPIIEWTKPIEQDGKIIGYWARAAVVKNGEVISTGEMPCGFDDFPSKGKTGIAQHRACVSAAETWAIAKAGRDKYAWVVTLAGYAPTPANEMMPEPRNMARSAPRQRAPRAATKAPESPVEAPKSPEPPPTAGKAIKVPNQVAVGEKMNGIEFVHASNQCGWDGDIVAKYLGSQSVTEWSEKNSHGDNYRPAWDFCVAAWKTQQIEELPW